MKERFSLLLLTGLIGLLLFSSGCGGGKAIEGGFDKPSGATLASASDSADIVTKGATSILRALTIMDGLIINQVNFFQNLLSPPYDNSKYNLTGTYPVAFGASNVQFLYTANVTPGGTGIDQDGYIAITATATSPVFSSTYKMRYHTAAADPGGRLTTDGYIKNFTISSAADAADVGALLVQVNKLQIKQAGENPFLIDPTDNANVTVSLLDATKPVEFSLASQEQRVSSAGGFSASYSKGSLNFLLDGELVYSTSGGKNTGYPTGKVAGSVITSQDKVTWGYSLNSTIQNRYYFKLTNDAIGFFDGTLILTK